MSAKLTVIFYILICFELGALLLVIPWLTIWGVSFWSENFFLYYLSSRLHWQGLIELMQSGYLRGAVSGLGLINLMIGFWEIKNFNRTVSKIVEEEAADENNKAKLVFNNQSADSQQEKR